MAASERVSVGYGEAPWASAYIVDGLSESPILTGIPDESSGLSYSYDNVWLAIGSSDTNLNILDPSSGALIQAITTGRICAGIDFSKANDLLAVGDKQAHNDLLVYDTSTWTLISPLPLLGSNTRPYDVSFNNDDSILACALHDSPYIRFLATSDWSILPNPTILPAASCRAISFSPDGSMVAIGSTGAPWLLVYNTSDLSLIPAPVVPPTDACYSVAFSPDNAYLAVGSHSAPYVLIYDTATWTKQPDLVPLPTRRSFVAYGDDGLVLAVGASDLYTYDTVTKLLIDSVVAPNLCTSVAMDHPQGAPVSSTNAIFLGMDF